MKRYKSFLARICEIENVSVKEIMELTGKSQAVVYSWLNSSKEECFPSIGSLGKILFRLGISFDDFIHCRHPVYDDGNLARVYDRYISGSLENRYLVRELLDLKNAEEVIKAYLSDRLCLISMIDDYLAGLEIDRRYFDTLCEAVKPFVVTNVVTDAEVEGFNLCSETLPAYKYGIDCIREIENDPENEDDDLEAPMHQIFFPDANRVILLAADNSIKLLKDYMVIIDETDKRYLLADYLEICTDYEDYDKKNRIIKTLIENKCEFFDKDDKNALEKHSALLKRVLRVR